MIREVLRPTLHAMLFFSLLAACSKRDASPQPPEKTVTFYTSYGYLQDGSWTIPMRVWVHEQPDMARRLLAKTAREQLMRRAGLESLDAEQEALFAERAHGFVADSESNEFVQFEFDDDPAAERFRIVNAEGLTDSDRNGLITGTVAISEARARELLAAQESTTGWLTFRAVSNDHGGTGRVRLISPSGVSVVSDIDDTIKVTNILAGGEEVIRNTFFREFMAAPCMAGMYGEFDGSTAFHYVSGGPWQLYQPLHDFLVDGPAGFPRGSFHMKNVRTNLSESESFDDLWKLADGGSKQATFEQKLTQIGTLLEHFPGRSFVLIGDSGEKDPEVFAAIRERAPERVADIRIRDVAGDVSANRERLAGMTVVRPDPDIACDDLVEHAPVASMN